MMSILIVDDEVIIADGIADMVQEEFDNRLAVYRAYSGMQAKEIIQETPVDILLADIDMPEISGLALHSWVAGRWPLCKVLFLTGYNEFAYVRQALDQSAFAYLLKSDGDGKIVEALERALSKIEQEQASLLNDPRLRMARPIYVKECVRALLHAGEASQEDTVARLAGWNLQLSLSNPASVAVGVLSGGPCTAEEAVSVLESILEGRLRHLVCDVNQSTLAILTQPYGSEDPQLFLGLLETAQRILQSEKGVFMTTLASRTPAPCEGLSSAYRRLVQTMNVVCPSPGEQLVVDISEDAPLYALDESAARWGDAAKLIQACYEYLLTGQEKLYYWETQKVWALSGDTPTSERVSMLYHALLLGIDMCMQGFPDHAAAFSRAKAEYAGALLAPLDIPKARWMIDSLASHVFRAQRETGDYRRQAMIQKVNRYVQENLREEDLSLTKIASAMHFHPAYLSRVYKEHAGIGISEYIWQQKIASACKMLTDSQMRIAEIAEALGFSSATYFTRFFRKQKGITPQEYRDRSS